MFVPGWVAHCHQSFQFGKVILLYYSLISNHNATLIQKSLPKIILFLCAKALQSYMNNLLT